MEARMIHTVPTETLESIEVDAALSNQVEAYELVERELNRRTMVALGEAALRRANAERARGLDS